MPADQPRLVLPVVDLRPGVPARTVWHSDAGPLGEVDHARVGAPAPGALLPVTLPRELAAHATELAAEAAVGDPAIVDAVLLEPLVSRLTLAGGGERTTLLRSAARTVRTAEVTGGGTAPATIEVYDAAGRLRSRHIGSDATLRVTVLPGGFTLVRRMIGAAPGRPWWRSGVFYQVYVRTFADSNGDGTGDLPRVTARLPHLVSLGVDTVWLTPFYPSAMVDGGPLALLGIT